VRNCGAYSIPLPWLSGEGSRVVVVRTQPSDDCRPWNEHRAEQSIRQVRIERLRRSDRPDGEAMLNFRGHNYVRHPLLRSEGKQTKRGVLVPTRPLFPLYTRRNGTTTGDPFQGPSRGRRSRVQADPRARANSARGYSDAILIEVRHVGTNWDTHLCAENYWPCGTANIPLPRRRKCALHPQRRNAAKCNDWGICPTDAEGDMVQLTPPRAPG